MKNIIKSIALISVSLLLLSGVSPDPKKHKKTGPPTECEKVTRKCEQQIATQTHVLKVLTTNYKRNRNTGLLKQIKVRKKQLAILKRQCAHDIKIACGKKKKKSAK